MTKEGKQPAQLHEMREGGDQNEMEVSESQRSGMIQNPKIRVRTKIVMPVIQSTPPG